MRDCGVRKEGGRSWIEFRGKIHVFVKNLRICAHCHESFKYASMAIDRVIVVVRDVNRYHTIKKGACSCRDYL
jgi:hypothetical protein